jgi:hypothetical protein
MDKMDGTDSTYEEDEKSQGKKLLVRSRQKADNIKMGNTKNVRAWTEFIWLSTENREVFHKRLGIYSSG